jgi:transcription elongation factor GreA-like protein
MKEGSVVTHAKFGNGKIKHMSDEKVIVDFGKFDITFSPAEATEVLKVK